MPTDARLLVFRHEHGRLIPLVCPDCGGTKVLVVRTEEGEGTVCYRCGAPTNTFIAATGT